MLKLALASVEHFFAHKDIQQDFHALKVKSTYAAASSPYIQLIDFLLSFSTIPYNLRS